MSRNKNRYFRHQNACECVLISLQTTSSGAKSGSSETTRGAERGTGQEREGCYYALLEFEKPVTCLPDSIVIGSRLDTDVHIHLKISQIVLF